MWRAKKINAYDIIDDKTNRVVASGLEESQAFAICDKHNLELSDKKWLKNGNNIESE